MPQDKLPIYPFTDDEEGEMKTLQENEERAKTPNPPQRPVDCSCLQTRYREPHEVFRKAPS